MEIILFTNFSKRRNSTKQPNDSSGRTKSVTLKDKCSIMNPSFFLADAEQYVYLKAWGYYYFIDSIEYDINGASYIRCTMDVLASFRTNILATSAFVKYSSSDYDVNILDTRITQLVTSDYTVHDYNFDEETPMFHNAGTYILTVTNDTYGVTHYAMDTQTLQGFLHDLINASNNIIENIVLRYGGLFSSIMSLRWLPVLEDVLPIAGYGEHIEIGLANFEITADRLTTNPHFTVGKTITIPWHYTDFRRHSMYTNIFITLPYIGKVEIDPMEVMGIDTLRITYTVNALTGTADVLIVKDNLGSEKVIATYNATIGRTLPISVTSIDAEGALAGMSSIVNAGTDMFAGSMTDYPTLTEQEFLSDTKTAVNGLLKGVLARLKGSTTSIGTYSGTCYEARIGSPIIEVISRDCRTTPEELTALYGRPCDKVRTMSSLSGYVETVGFFINVSCLRDIKEKINKQMDTGVYLE